eukprot:GHVS01052013.1.p1 GENE.GHVS01052013.1~~GHVS01052013.1.p1  ORF type:complete len:407 (+),score=40.30 GHVS01052013.1:68-1222(+)
MGGISLLLSPVVLVPSFCCFCYCLTIFIIDEDSPPPLPTIYRYIYYQPLSYLFRLLRAVIGDSGVRRCLAVRNYLVYTNNPIVQIFYAFIVAGGYLLFVYAAFPLLPGPYLSSWHKFGSFFISVSCFVCFTACSTSDPGVVHERNCELLTTVYPYDGVMFTRTDCQTCGNVKPARSKHCALCNRCVARFDHHCVWIGNCVGANNHKLFLLFLLLNCLMCFYGAFLCASILRGIITTHNLLNATFVDSITGQRLPSTPGLVFSYLTGHQSCLVGLLLICGLFSLALLCFLAWHLYMAFWSNMTTNESFKLKAIKMVFDNTPELQDELPDVLVTNRHNKGVWDNVMELTDWKGFIERRNNHKKAVRRNRRGQDSVAVGEPKKKYGK